LLLEVDRILDAVLDPVVLDGDAPPRLPRSDEDGVRKTVGEKAASNLAGRSQIDGDCIVAVVVAKRAPFNQHADRLVCTDSDVVVLNQTIADRGSNRPIQADRRLLAAIAIAEDAVLDHEVGRSFDEQA